MNAPQVPPGVDSALVPLLLPWSADGDGVSERSPVVREALVQAAVVIIGPARTSSPGPVHHGKDHHPECPGAD